MPAVANAARKKEERGYTPIETLPALAIHGFTPAYNATVMDRHLGGAGPLAGESLALRDKLLYGNLHRVGEIRLGGAKDAYYLPGERAVYTHRDASPGVLAHELGHAVNHHVMGDGWTNLYDHSMNASRRFGKWGGVLASAASPYLSDTQLGAVGLAGATISTPMLAEETAASIRGYKMLRGVGSGRLRAITAFAGVPTYAALASVPVLPYLTRKMDRAIHGDGRPKLPTVDNYAYGL